MWGPRGHGAVCTRRKRAGSRAHCWPAGHATYQLDKAETSSSPGIPRQPHVQDPTHLPPPVQPTSRSGFSPTMASCSRASSPITVWCSSTCGQAQEAAGARQWAGCYACDWPAHPGSAMGQGGEAWPAREQPARCGEQEVCVRGGGERGAWLSTQVVVIARRSRSRGSARSPAHTWPLGPAQPPPPPRCNTGGPGLKLAVRGMCDHDAD